MAAPSCLSLVAHRPRGPVAAGCSRAARDQRHVGSKGPEESCCSPAPAAGGWGMRRLRHKTRRALTGRSSLLARFTSGFAK
jgi:hypothetical protein